MAYDEVLAGRIRELLSGEPGITERKMFGGLAFLADGNMAVSVSGQGGIFVRVDTVKRDGLIETSSAYPMVMSGREMRGWLRIDAEEVRTKRQLMRWAGLGTTFARSLPAKAR
jgi:TfoX/Sxy family transcriptional regulator of competence genes